MSAELIRAPEPVGEGALADHPRQLTDGFGRSFPYLRLSLTEACNFRCSYCLPDGYQADGRPRFLQVEEIARLVRAFAALGMSKIRLTGGEPSLRKDRMRSSPPWRRCRASARWPSPPMARCYRGACRAGTAPA